MKRIILESEKCINCKLCQQLCSLRKSGEISSDSAFVRVVKGDRPSINICLQCGIKLCSEVCLHKAISVSSVGATFIDPEKCDGCGKCVGACINNAIVLTENVTAKVCDLCGGTPECVAICPTGALLFDEIDEFRKRKVSEAGRKLLDAMGRR